jgi:hypothetical protein
LVRVKNIRCAKAVQGLFEGIDTKVSVNLSPRRSVFIDGSYFNPVGQ